MIVWIQSLGRGKITAKRLIGSDKCYLEDDKFVDNKKSFYSTYSRIYKQLNLNK